MPNHLKFCGCPVCRSAMRAKSRAAGKVRRAVRRIRHKAKLALHQGKEPAPTAGVESLD